MQVIAVSLGYAVPNGDFDASVHSVFHSSLNLNARGVNGLLTVTGPAPFDLPQGIRLQGRQGLDFRELTPGAPATCRDGRLSLPESALRIDLRRARRWACDLAAMEVDLGDPPEALAWECAWEALNAHQRQEGAEIVGADLLQSGCPNGSTTADHIGQALRRLLLATRKHGRAATDAARALLGLGNGLTPTGDDLLVGFLAGLWCTLRDIPARQRSLADLAKAVRDRSVGTNDISRTYLLHAARGQVSSHLMETARAIRAGAPTHRIHRHIGLSARIGHASGLESLTGLLLGLAAWDGPLLVH